MSDVFAHWILTDQSSTRVGEAEQTDRPESSGGAGRFARRSLSSATLPPRKVFPKTEIDLLQTLAVFFALNCLCFTYRSKNRILLLAANSSESDFHVLTSRFPHLAVPFENSTRKLIDTLFSGQRGDGRRAKETNLSVRSAKQIKDYPFKSSYSPVTAPDIPFPEAKPHGSTAAVSWL